MIILAYFENKSVEQSYWCTTYILWRLKSGMLAWVWYQSGCENPEKLIKLADERKRSFIWDDEYGSVLPFQENDL